MPKKYKLCRPNQRKNTVQLRSGGGESGRRHHVQAQCKACYIRLIIYFINNHHLLYGFRRGMNNYQLLGLCYFTCTFPRCLGSTNYAPKSTKIYVQLSRVKTWLGHYVWAQCKDYSVYIYTLKSTWITTFFLVSGGWWGALTAPGCAEHLCYLPSMLT